MAHRGDGLSDIFEHDVIVRDKLKTTSGTIEQTPVDDKDIVNKAYCDANAGGHDPVTVTDGTTINFTLTGQDITAETIDSAINHDALFNFSAAEHIDWTVSQAPLFIHANNYVDNDTTDHTALSNIGTNTHAQIDTHIASSAIHFTVASISHTAIQNIGTNTHAQIDTHIASSAIHFTAASVDHTAIQNIGTNTHAQIDSHISDTSDPHGANTTQTGTASCARVIITDDESTVSLAYVRNIVLGTSATPPTVSNFPRGTIYLQYTI